MNNLTEKQRAALEERHPDELDDDLIHPDEIKPVEKPKQEIQQNLTEEEPEEYVYELVYSWYDMICLLYLQNVIFGQISVH